MIERIFTKKTRENIEKLIEGEGVALEKVRSKLNLSKSIFADNYKLSKTYSRYKRELNKLYRNCMVHEDSVEFLEIPVISKYNILLRVMNSNLNVFSHKQIRNDLYGVDCSKKINKLLDYLEELDLIERTVNSFKLTLVGKVFQQGHKDSGISDKLYTYEKESLKHYTALSYDF